MASESVDAAAMAAGDARQRVSATIDEIQDRLDPRRIVGDAFDRVQSSSRALASQAGDTARSHPLAIGAAVAALGLALLARNHLANATVDLGDGTDDYTDYDDDYADYGAASPAPARPRPARLQAVAGRAGSAVQDNPTASIVVGLIAGAALGAFLPTSDAERRTLGDVGSRIGAAARAAARTASDELDAAGLNVDRVRSMASDVTAKARTAALSVVDAAKAELTA